MALQQNDAEIAQICISEIKECIHLIKVRAPPLPFSLRHAHLIRPANTFLIRFPATTANRRLSCPHKDVTFMLEVEFAQCDLLMVQLGDKKMSYQQSIIDVCSSRINQYYLYIISARNPPISII